MCAVIQQKPYRLQICQLVQRELATMGFTPKQQATNHGQWSSGQMAYNIRYASNIILCGAYVLVEANSLGEYMVSIFELIWIIATLICFVSISFKNDKLFEIIEQCETELTISKCNWSQRFFSHWYWSDWFCQERGRTHSHKQCTRELCVF